MLTRERYITVEQEEIAQLFVKKFGLSVKGEKSAKRGVGLPPDERIFLAGKESISYCFPPEIIPFASIKNDEAIGMVTDDIDIFSDKLSIFFRIVPSDSLLESQEQFKTVECGIPPVLTMSARANNFYYIFISYTPT